MSKKISTQLQTEIYLFLKELSEKEITNLSYIVIEASQLVKKLEKEYIAEQN